MKKLLISLLIALILFWCVIAPEPVVEPEMYLVPGHYYTIGEVITEDGNVWGYTQDIISDVPSYDNESVYVLMYDAGTPDNIYDDEIIGLIGR